MLLLSYLYYLILFFVPVALLPNAVYGLIILRFLDHPQRRTTVYRTPLDERSARRRDLYLATHETHNRQTSMPPGDIRTYSLSKRDAPELRLRRRGHRDLHLVLFIFAWLAYLYLRKEHII